METYKASSAEVVIDGDVLTLTRKKIGKDDVRRIPLAAVTGVRTKPGGRLTAALLQLVLNDEPPADMTLIEPNTLSFATPKHRATMAELQARLEAVIEQNRAAGGGPVAYDAPRKGLIERASHRLEEVSDKLGEVRERLDESRTHVDVGGERVNKIDVELAEAGITRPDVVAAAHATADFLGMSIEIPPLAQVLRPDEPLLRAARATIGDRIGLAAVTAARLVFLDRGMYGHRSHDEYPLTGIVGVSMASEFMSNAVTVRTHSGHTVVLERVPDIDGFAAALREAVHNATTPPPAPPALAPPVGPAVGQLPPPAPAPAAQPDLLAQIAKLGELHTAGVLTAEEFQAKKTELLNRL